MIEWDFILTPLLVLPIVLLFRFVGCGLNLVGEAQPAPPAPPADPPEPSLPPPSNPPQPPDPEPKPKYRDYILGELTKHDVIAYWRLVDPLAAESTIEGAADEKGFKKGTYHKTYTLPPITPTPTAAGSKGPTPVGFTAGQPSLIVTDPAVNCRLFNGGHVRVEFTAGLYTDQFTIEAWIKAAAFDVDYEYVLFDAGGRYTLPGMPLANRGFRLFIDRQRGWQVQLAPANVNLFSPTPIVPLGAQTHVALTVDGPATGAKTVRLYLDGKIFTPSVAVNAYTRPDGAPLFIGIGNVADTPTSALQLRHPVLCHIQEVVLHKKALSQLEIQTHVDINKL